MANLARHGRVAATVLALTLFGLLIPATSVFAAVVNPASGGTPISADQFGTAHYTPLAGPAIAEGSIGELALNSTTILNIPAGFRFDVQAGTAGTGGNGCDLRAKLTVTTTQAAMTVTQASTVSGCILMFNGLEVQPTSGSGLTSGNITKTGTSLAPGGSTNYGTLTKVAGAVAELIYLTQPSPSNNGGSAFGRSPAVLARDQFGNPVAKARVGLSITPGTGATGAHLACTTNPLRASATGVADFAGDRCRIDRVGTYRLQATSGRATRDSGSFSVVVGPAIKLVFTAYPGAKTYKQLVSQPTVAITDAGGNTVTTFPTSTVTIAINKHAAAFSCPTSGFRVATVRGVAHFAGCQETITGTGYRLTAWLGFANATGKVFEVIR